MWIFFRNKHLFIKDTILKRCIFIIISFGYWILSYICTIHGRNTRLGFFSTQLVSNHVLWMCIDTWTTRISICNQYPSLIESTTWLFFPFSRDTNEINHITIERKNFLEWLFYAIKHFILWDLTEDEATRNMTHLNVIK